ncbi:MAG TPA: DUF3857 domain-containing protein [Candidatus Sulfotelmatobacter sp.]|nr:DUF3857 domain-containing protein [Candidatus Sulfotelmatobacter sp.]
MGNWKALLLLHCFVVLIACARAVSAADSFSIAPPAQWVNVQSLAADVESTTNTTDDNLQYVLLDDQVNVSLNEHYHRVVEEPVNANGVQDCVQLSMDFDPSYERLVIHDIVIHRGTNVLNRLDAGKIKVIQQERDLDMNVFNGEVSAVVFLEDVRIGDRIDYSYTVIGANPIFGGRYIDNFYLGWSSPVAKQRFRLLWPTRRFLGIKNHGTEAKPAVKENGDTTEYVWEFANLPAINAEDLLPTWYDAYPWVQFSEFASWEKVGQWAANLYPHPKNIDPKLQEKISQWMQLYQSPEARLAAALEFVQNDIRYMGIEVGPNSHQPNDPSLVFERRFGDCKDKSYLFCTLCQAMGIDASEIMVDTGNMGTVQDWLPSPYAFDHVVSRVRLNGKTYWLDPTAVNQGGAIDDRFFPDYGCGLLARPDTTDLTIIPQQQAGWPKTTIRETFVVHERKEPAEYTVQTLAVGSDADQLRQTFADQTREELQKNYLNYYAKEYPNISVARPLEVVDHRDQNTFETIEHYKIQQFWTLSDDKKNFECDFYPQTIRDLFVEPATTLRSMPLAMTYPCHSILTTKVILPEDWPIDGETNHFQCDAAELDATRVIGKNSFEMTYEYQTLSNVVSPAAMPDYVKTLNQMKDALGYSLTWATDDVSVVSSTPAKTPNNATFNWTIGALGGIYLILLAVVAAAVHHFWRGAPMPPPLDASGVQLSGLGGWLILPAIGLFLSPLRAFMAVAGNASVYAPETWHTLTDPSGAAYNGLWAPLLILEFLSNLTIMVFAILLLILFFQRRRIFPVLFIVFLVFVAVTTTIDHFSVQLIPAAAKQAGDSTTDLTQCYVPCLIWIPYMLNSRRVKSTFLR